MTTAVRAIDKMIRTPNKQVSKQQARKILRDCGVIDKNNNVSPAYRKIVEKVD